MYASVSLSTAARNYIITALPVLTKNEYIVIIIMNELKNYVIISKPRQNIIIAIIIMNLIFSHFQLRQKKYH